MECQMRKMHVYKILEEEEIQPKPTAMELQVTRL